MNKVKKTGTPKCHFANNFVGTTLLETTLGGNRERQMSLICLFYIDFLRNFVKLNVCSENKLLALEDSEFLTWKLNEAPFIYWILSSFQKLYKFYSVTLLAFFFKHGWCQMAWDWSSVWGSEEQNAVKKKYILI